MISRAIILVAVALMSCSLAMASAESTSIVSTNRMLSGAPLGPDNLWPKFRFQIRDVPIKASEDLSPEDRAGMFTNAVVPPMPYLIQDNYTRQRTPAQLPAIQVENNALKATFYPSLGGRLISLFDKRRNRELLFDNPVFQPANLAIRNAWFSGGVEWNGPLYGHSLLTCSPVFAGLVETTKGRMLRLYEFDRALETTWQVDVLLPVDDDRLWVHVRAINPNDHDIDFYWWTNIAVPLTHDTRVLAPTDYALSHDATGNARIAFPQFDGFDGSYPRNYPYAKSVFFRKPGIERPWSVYVDGTGHGLSHVSTKTLSGRKLFVWGCGSGGKRWMDFLSEPGKGDYVEIQGGVTPTQLQTRPLKAGACIEWTECLSPLALDAKLAHHPDFFAASAAAEKVVDARVPNATLLKMHEFLCSQADAPVKTLLHSGSAWGALYEKRIGKKISAGLDFNARISAEERSWAELLETGTFSKTSLGEEPRSFNVSTGWVSALNESVKKHGATWLHHLHLGVAKLENGEFSGAEEHFLTSLSLKESAVAQRCLALLRERGGRLDSAEKAYERAWLLCGNDLNLAIEVCEFLVRHTRHDAFNAFANKLPPNVGSNERIELLKAQVALAQNNFDLVRRVLEREFCTVREGELSLTDLWFAWHLKEAQLEKGSKLTAQEKQAVMAKYPPPRQIDFRMK